MGRTRTAVAAIGCAACVLSACGSSNGATKNNGSVGAPSGTCPTPPCAATGGLAGLPGNAMGTGAGGRAMTGTGGTLSGTGGTSVPGTGGAVAMNGTGGMMTGSGGMSAAGSGGGTTPPPPPGTWPAADPALKGPFAIVTENNVGPGMAFTLVRPMDLAQSGQLHPVITWGNGTGTTPTAYGFLINQLASHGFVVIASNSMNVGQGPCELRPAPPRTRLRSSRACA